ncbi:MAG: hypothetical protein ACK56I_22180, partial [bacterium]
EGSVEGEGGRRRSEQQSTQVRVEGQGWTACRHPIRSRPSCAADTPTRDTSPQCIKLLTASQRPW